MQRVGIVIVEGLSDFIVEVARQSDANEDESAILGIMSGSWTQTFADKIPNQTRVIIATDHDSTGKKYAMKIKKTLSNRVTVLGWKPPGI